MCGVRKEKIRFGFQMFSDASPEEMLTFWMKFLDVPRTRFFENSSGNPISREERIYEKIAARSIDSICA